MWSKYFLKKRFVLKEQLIVKNVKFDFVQYIRYSICHYETKHSH